MDTSEVFPEGSREWLQREAQLAGVPFVDLHRIEIAPNVAKLISRECATAGCMIPIKADASKVWIAMANFHDAQALEAARLQTDRIVLPVAAMREEVVRAINECYK